jgi:arylsulfatase A-like enzyme
MSHPACTDRATRAQLAVCLLAFSGAGCALAPEHPALAAKPELAATSATNAKAEVPQAAPSKPRKPKVIVFVWDGLRPDSVSEQNTPNLARLRDHEGANFADQHAVYPTFTMMNAAAFATGAYPGHHGFYGNTEYQPGPTGNNADGKPVDYSQPVFTEDHAVLQTLDAFYRAQGSRGLFAVDTLFQVAHAAGLHTAAIGKIGPAFLQDYRPDDERSVILDENIAFPFGFARSLQGAGFALPVNTVRYPYPGEPVLKLAANNGKPSAALNEKIVRLKDGATPDPRSALGSAHNAANEYLMSAYLDYVLSKLDPDLSMVWLRNPDSTEHQFGPGSSNYLDALRDQDALLGKLESKLGELGLRESTDLIVVSDHGHSTVSGDLAIFPLRALSGEPDGHGEVGAVDNHGYSVSGELRTADVLTRAGFKHVYDGSACLLDPVLSGIRKDGSLVYPPHTDSAGKCLPKGMPYSLPGFHVDAAPPRDAIIIAANGGSEYFYVLNQSRESVQALARALQERSTYGAIFVRGKYGAIPGTLPLSAIQAEGNRSSPPTPDLIVSFAWDEAAAAGGDAGLPGTEYASAQRYRGMHGSFSPRDIHNTLIASGPHFKVGFTDSLPTGNVDVAPTVAELLGLHFDAPDGRILNEALVGHDTTYSVEPLEQSSDAVQLRRTCAPDDPSCSKPTGPSVYSITLRKKVLTQSDTHATFTYFDRATATRRSTGGARK